MSDTDKIIDEYLKGKDIHEERQAGLFGAGVSLVAAFVASLVMGVNTYLAFWTDFPFIFSIIIHFAVCGIVIVFAKALQKMGRDSRFMFLLGITCLVTGVFGAIGSFVSIILHFWHMRGAQTFWDWYSSIFPDLDETRPEEVYDDITFGRDENALNYSVVPFMDVMSAGSEDQKREALSRMTERFEPAFAPAFKRALNDDSNSIRVQAATAVAKIENGFLERLLKINEVAKKHGSDPVVKLAQAEHYDNYAFTGILDFERERLNRRRAIQHYEEYLSVKPTDQEAGMRYGRLLLRDKRFVEGADWFKKLIDNGTNSDRSIGWYLEALYGAGRYNELRSYAKSVSKKVESLAEKRPNLVRSIKFWADEPFDESIIAGETA